MRNQKLSAIPFFLLSLFLTLLPENKKGEAKRPRRENLFQRLVLGRAIRHDVDAMAGFVEENFAVRQGKQGPIAARADILSGNEFRTALADQNAARGHELAA